MNRNSLVKLFLGGSHIDGHTYSLHDFIYISTNSMYSNDSFYSWTLYMTDHFEQRSQLKIIRLTERIEHISELTSVHFDIVFTIQCLGFSFIRAYDSNRRMREDHGRHQRVVHFEYTFIRMEQSLHQFPTSHDGYRSQLGSLSHITYSIYTCSRSILIFIYLYISFIIQFYSCFF